MLRGVRGRRIDRPAVPELPSGLVRHECSGRHRLEIDPDTLDRQAVESVTGIEVSDATRHAVAVLLWPDGESPYDSLAIGIWIEGVRVGWLTHADSAAVSAVVKILAEADTALECGAMLEGEPAGEDGVRLGGWVAFDPERASAAVAARSGSETATGVRRFVSPT